MNKLHFLSLPYSDPAEGFMHS